ncbi:MAG: Hpt domain-containing protein [Bryobacteraceae bacterium]|nr:Hpt domain-containing protein [Bryobacteraceae bacterium]MBC8166561.1 Hpt domain-containing protein [Bryobacteraceae bacterium]
MANTTFASDTDQLEISALLDRVGGDEELLREITGIFLEEYLVLISEIREAVETGDCVQLERSAHSLKGSVSNFGAADATRAACDLEVMGRSKQMSDTRRALRVLEDEFASLAPALKAIVG